MSTPDKIYLRNGVTLRDPKEGCSWTTCWSYPVPDGGTEYVRSDLYTKLQNELETTKRHWAEDWADDDTAIKNICKKHGILEYRPGPEHEGGGFKSMVDCVEELSSQLSALKREVDEALCLTECCSTLKEMANAVGDGIHARMECERLRGIMDQGHATERTERPLQGHVEPET